MKAQMRSRSILRCCTLSIVFLFRASTRSMNRAIAITSLVTRRARVIKSSPMVCSEAKQVRYSRYWQCSTTSRSRPDPPFAWSGLPRLPCFSPTSISYRCQADTAYLSSYPQHTSLWSSCRGTRLTSVSRHQRLEHMSDRMLAYATQSHQIYKVRCTQDIRTTIHLARLNDSLSCKSQS